MERIVERELVDFEKFKDRLRTAKTLKIEVPFHGERMHVFTFHVEGLPW